MGVNNLSKKAIISVTITVILIILAVFANFVTIRIGTRYVIELDFYNKLSVAYEFGGISGLKKELVEIEASSKSQYELKAAAEFRKKLGEIREPKDYLNKVVFENRSRIVLLRNLRNSAMALIIIILILKLFLWKGKTRWVL